MKMEISMKLTGPQLVRVVERSADRWTRQQRHRHPGPNRIESSEGSRQFERRMDMSVLGSPLKGLWILPVVLMAAVTSYAAPGPAPWVTVVQAVPQTQLKPQPRDTIVVAIEQDVSTLDPAGALGTHTQRTMANVFESLVDTSSPDGSVEPWLAQSWTISKDNKEYTFRLRQGIKFQDGTPLNAEAVKFSIDRSLDTTNPYY